jgi:hypothetical protein
MVQCNFNEVYHLCHKTTMATTKPFFALVPFAGKHWAPLDWVAEVKNVWNSSVMLQHTYELHIHIANSLCTLYCMCLMWKLHIMCGNKICYCNGFQYIFHMLLSVIIWSQLCSFFNIFQS